MTLAFKEIHTPVGRLKLVTSEAGLIAVLWENDSSRRVRLGSMIAVAHHPILVKTENQLRSYFAGSLSDFTVPLELRGTDFQKSVWHALITIPFGQTRSYFQIASQIGKPTAARAVGAANGRNPISIITPCHRVISSSGHLTGFAGGLQAKRFLLAHERSSLLF